MGNDKAIIKYIEQLPSVLDKYGISKEDICICGSSVLSVWGIRLNRDLDFVINPEVRDKLIDKFRNELDVRTSTGAIYYSDEIQSTVDRYNNIGISDAELVNNSQYYTLEDGWKCARIEMEIATKTKRGREKDIKDLKKSEEFLSSYSDFDWDFFRKCLSVPPVPIINDQKQIIKPRSSFFSRLSKKVLRSVKKAAKILWSLLLFVKKVIKVLVLNPRKILRKIEEIVHPPQVTAVLSIPVHSELASITDFMTSPATLLGMQFKDGVFNRYDVIMRYLSIEKIEKDFNAPLTEYDVMQKKRVNRDTAGNFYSLIASIKSNGFSTKYPLQIDLNANLIDGSHRLACSLYYNVDRVPYSVIQQDSNILYGLDWFRKQGFDEDILLELERTKKKLFLQKGIYFCATIWGVAKKFFDDISSDIGNLYKIVYQDDLFLGNNYGRLIDDIYAIDDIAGWKVLTKKQLLYQALHEIRFVLFEIPNPDFRIKKRNHSYLSSKGAVLKKMIREKYRLQIPNYFYDIIIHTGDNYEHNEEMIKAIQKHTVIDIDKII